VSGSNGITRWWVNGRLVGELSRPLVSPQTVRFANTYIGRSNWGHDQLLTGNVYFFSALNGALTPQQAVDKSAELLQMLGRPPIASLGNGVRFVRVKAPTQGDAWLQIAQLQVRKRASSRISVRRYCAGTRLAHSSPSFRCLTSTASTSPLARLLPPPVAMAALQTPKLPSMATLMFARILLSFTAVKQAVTGSWLILAKRSTSEESCITTEETVVRIA
jgi:hypothetical protein